MERSNLSDESIKMNVPVEVNYLTINELLQQKFRGKILSKGKDNGETVDRAQIEEIFLEKSEKAGFELSLELKIKLLTSFFKNKKVEMIVYISPLFNPENQEISVQNYEIDGLNNGWIINNLLEGLVNSFLYNNLKDKMKFDLQPLLNDKILEFNEKLSGGLEVKDGIFLSGTVNNFRVDKVVFEEDVVIAFLDITGNNKIKIEKIEF